MQYVVCFAVATPLLLVWLSWSSAATVPVSSAPLSHYFDEDPHQADVLKERALADLNAAQTGAIIDNRDVQQSSFARPKESASAK